MIFLCTGSRNYQFDRLIKTMDLLVETGEIKEEVFAQIGNSNYLPLNFHYEKYLDSKIFEEMQNKARVIVSHGGTGAIVGALKKGKYVVGVPRLEKYGEALDNHQLQILEIFEAEGYIKCAKEMGDLLSSIRFYDNPNGIKVYQRESLVKDIIDNYIQSWIKVEKSL